ncbi:MAG: SAM-dependent methyltransferase [Thermodesulfobacteriota bacterium]|nr:SAM-dependent methyltransferase [Thermodesulfobacteriota bacterium]
MEEEKRDRGEKLKSFILSRIEERGPLAFSQFMEWCLYHPEYGYYHSEETRIGKNGDYYTGPCVHPLFGGMVAKQLSQMAEILGRENFDVVEMGGGRGFLCQDILDWTKKNTPLFHDSLKYHLLETSPSLQEEQKRRLSEHEKEGKVFWMDPADFEEGKKRIRGCLLSNELVDAFPVHLVIVDHGLLKEIYVTQKNGRLEERKGDLSDPRIASYFESMGIQLEEGQRAEVNLRALEWMEKVAHFLEKGFVLTIDYGYLAEELYSPHRRNGTLLCYYRHQTSENPYEHLGEQDITSHVNFTGLIKKGEEAGLRFTGLVPQYRFLIALGILQEMDFLGQDLSELDGLKMRLSLMHLIEPEAGMGEMFKVLIQHKGISHPELDGLRDLNSIPWPT